jgi:hypothetical protein
MVASQTPARDSAGLQPPLKEANALLQRKRRAWTTVVTHYALLKLAAADIEHSKIGAAGYAEGAIQCMVTFAAARWAHTAAVAADG